MGAAFTIHLRLLSISLYGVNHVHSNTTIKSLITFQAIQRLSMFFKINSWSIWVRTNQKTICYFNKVFGFLNFYNLMLYAGKTINLAIGISVLMFLGFVLIVPFFRSSENFSTQHQLYLFFLGMMYIFYIPILCTFISLIQDRTIYEKFIGSLGIFVVIIIKIFEIYFVRKIRIGHE